MHSRNGSTIGRNLEQNQLIQVNGQADFRSAQSQNCCSTIDDTARESFRLSTFNNFVENFPVNFCLVAAHGYFYTGNGTTIKCFSCNETAQLSNATNDRWLRQIHKRNCNFANGNDTRNISIQEHSPYENGRFSLLMNDSIEIQGDFPEIQERFSLQASQNEAYLHSTNGFSTITDDFSRRNEETFSDQMLENRNYSDVSNHSIRTQDHFSPSFRETLSIQPSNSSANGVCADLVTQNHAAPTMSIQRNNTSDVISIQSDRPRANEQSHIIINGNYVSTNFGDNLNDVIPRQQQRSQPRISPRELASIFPCNHPINPHMRSVDTRLESFYEHIAVWSNSSQLRATVDELVEAGLFCLGERDRTKCWYCNGGLQNWKRDDDPWEEHAKWFPMCEFVLQKKGPDYVHRIVARFPNLRRPQMLNQISESSRQHHSSVVPIPSSPRSSSRGYITSGLDSMISDETEERGPIIVDPENERRERERKLEAALNSSGLVTQARIMGFPETSIKLALKRQFDLHNENFKDMDQFIDAIMATSNNSSNRESTSASFASASQPNSSHHSSRNSSPSNLSAQSALQEIRNLTESRNCRRCHINPACIVFIPCGHMVCCHECQDGWECCPACQAFIREKIRSFLS